LTQILSVITHDYVLMASDRRLTRATGERAGEVLSDDTCKLVSLCHTYGIGYSGLAYLGGRPTHEWIATTLADANCHDVDNASNVLVQATPPALHAAPPELRRQIFIFAGWAQFDSPPGLHSHFCVVTNALDESGRVLAKPLDEFSRRVRALRDEESLLWHSILPLSNDRASTLDRNLRRLVAREIGPQEALRLLVDEILFAHRAIDRSSVGDKILGFCIPKASVERQLQTGETMAIAHLPNERTVAFTYYDPAYNELRQYGPTYVCGGLAQTDIETENDPTRGFQSSQLRILRFPKRKA
jgi:hypothetical protein